MPVTTLDLKARRFVAGAQEFARLLGAGWLGLRDIWHYRRQVVEAMVVFGSSASFLVLASGLFLGLVLALEWGTKLEQFGAKLLMGQIVAIGVVREIGPMITGIMVAGRTGAKMAAEIGSMKVTDQLDALRALGMDPVARLVMPRQVAVMITMFPLTVMADALAIIGGWFVAVQWLGIKSNYFWSSALDSLTFKDLAVGYCKPLFFGYIIASISAYYGMTTKGGAAGVGDSATKAVMYSSLSILIVDFILGKLVLALFG
ncbi:MAG: ABC transporter permease [Candidatus Eisenbacteria bacterium]|uniref:ABC transporter permease n=1 Tax=Eiseniibacteriota bacterium TaxID=2212470 RepID=A0A7Y2E8F6_UNCEI|nr:ABC transporter permease [Candidatus Eisenbacteria bacterium]